MGSDILTMSVEEIAPLIESKLISPVELTNRVLEHSEYVNQEINAYIQFLRKDAEKSAIDAEREIMGGNYRGMYHGIPIGIKDNIYIKDRICTIGSKIHQGFIPKYNAKVIDNLRSAGAIFIGKLNMHEYAWGITNNNPHYGSCRNPWKLEVISGGSSGGSGASVSANMAFASLGTDTGGSIRIPAAACGIVGLKPTFGIVSNSGSFPLAPTLDHIGPMTKTVKDAAGLLNIIRDRDLVESKNFIDGLSENLKVEGLVIGLNQKFFFKNVDKEIEKQINKNIKVLVDKGAIIKEFDLPSLKKARWAQSVILQSEFANVHRENKEKRLNDFGKDIQEQFNSELPSVIEYLHALEVREDLIDEFKDLFKSIDIIIAPTLSVMPPKVDDKVTYVNGKEVTVFESILRLTGIANITGLPSISIPCGSNNDLPIGLQLIGPYYGEDKLLNISYFLEKTFDCKRLNYSGDNNY